jgi:hypothetical protein
MAQVDKLSGCFAEVCKGLHPRVIASLKGQAPTGTADDSKLKEGMNQVVWLYLDNQEPMAPTLIWADHTVEAAINWFCNLTPVELNNLNN